MNQFGLSIDDDDNDDDDATNKKKYSYIVTINNHSSVDIRMFMIVVVPENIL